MNAMHYNAPCVCCWGRAHIVNSTFEVGTEMAGEVDFDATNKKTALAAFICLIKYYFGCLLVRNAFFDVIAAE